RCCASAERYRCSRSCMQMTSGASSTNPAPATPPSRHAVQPPRRRPRGRGTRTGGTDAGGVTCERGTTLAWDTTGNSGLNPTTNFLGTADVQPLAIRTNGTEALRVGATGNVGLGISSPGARLHVHGGRNNEWGLIVSSAGGSAYGLKIN